MVQMKCGDSPDIVFNTWGSYGSKRAEVVDSLFFFARIMVCFSRVL